ncbi:MAG: ABC transporter permease [Gemmatimonadetes bacterium]|nr:ABC transporter permease [Gemmatimonadota bacterium]
MWKSNLIIALRVLGRNRTISLINVVGLSAALAVVVLCLLFVRHETSYDSWHEKGDRIFYVHLEDPDRAADLGGFKISLAQVTPKYREAVRTTVAGIRESVYLKTGNGTVSYGETSFEEPFLAVDPAFLTLFTLPLTAGDAASALDDPHSVVLGHETAQKYFGPDVPAHAMLGEHIRLHVVRRGYPTSPPPIDVDLTITGVLAPLPGPTILHRLDVLVPIETTEELGLHGIPGLFIELEEGVEPAEMEARLAPLASTKFSKPELELIDLQGAYFGPPIWDPVRIGQGKIEHCYLLAGLAAVVLLIAAINFINLALGRAMTRALEIGLRKTIGATRPQLSNQFLAEAIVVSVVAAAGGMALAELLLPAFNQLVHRQLDLEWLSAETGIGGLTLALVVGVLSGLYPAQVTARLNPVGALPEKPLNSAAGTLAAV